MAFAVQPSSEGTAVFSLRWQDMQTKAINSGEASALGVPCMTGGVACAAASGAEPGVAHALASHIPAISRPQKVRTEITAASSFDLQLAAV